MKTAVDKNESSFAKMKRESLEWLERNGKAAPPFIALAVNLSHEPVTAKTEKEKYYECPDCGYRLTETEYFSVNYDYGCPKCKNSFHNFKKIIIQQETNEQPKRVSAEEKTPEAIFKDFASFNKFLYDLTQYEMEVVIAMLYEQKAYASQHPIEQEKLFEKSAEEILDLQQYITNLLYYAHVEAMDMHSIDFDRWVESQVDNIKEFYASQKHLPTDEEIGAKKNELFSQWNNPYTDDELNHNDNMERYRKGFDAAIEWLRDKLNNKEK